MMKELKWGLSLAFFLLVLIVITWFSEGQDIWKGVAVEADGLHEAGLAEPPALDPVRDNMDIYDADEDDRLYEIYVTVLPPMTELESTFESINNAQYSVQNGYLLDGEDPYARVHFSEKPDLDMDVESVMPNGTMELRGQSSRRSPMKSYKIKLFDDTPLWDGFQVINLNKHYGDDTSVRNKLSYDFMERMPELVGMRTRFVKLQVRDLSESPQADYVDYGLYTFIEQPNKAFLRRHGLDEEGYLYKAEFFEFHRLPEIIRPENSVSFDPTDIEAVLEVGGRPGTDKLIDMLEAINDRSRNIDEIVDTYFDRENLLSWVAVNILFDNTDTNSRNYMLYSPLNDRRWYFIPWDYDKGWGLSGDRAKWEQGLSNYWGMVVFNRFFKNPENVEALSDKLEELGTVITAEETKSLLDSYYELAYEEALYRKAAEGTALEKAEFDDVYYTLPQMIKDAQNHYYLALESPMPFFLGDPVFSDSSIAFNWDQSYDIQGDDVRYDFQIARDPKFQELVASKPSMIETSIEVGLLPPGTYYWRVIARDDMGNWQMAFDCYFDPGSRTYYGTRMLVIP